MKYKVFIGLTEIAGYNNNLKRGFKENNIECTFINLSKHPFNYGGDDEPNIFVKLCKWNLRQMSIHNSRLVKAPFYLFIKLLSIPIFIWALFKYDVFIFGYGSSFFNFWDLPILKLFNKKIIFTFFGSDGRPPYIGAWHDINIRKYKKKTKNIKSNIQKIERYTDYIVTHTASAHFHQKKFIKYLSIGFPFSDTPKINNKLEKSQQIVKIIHSPSNPIAKGSSLFRASIEKLKEKGYLIDYIEIIGKPHLEVINLLQSCDFVLDQVYSDTPMSGFAAEAAFFAKPAVVGGYYAQYIYNEYAPEDIPPSLFCHPDKINDAIEQLIKDKIYREDLGRRAQEFVRTRWTPKEVAKRYMQIIQGVIPDNWIADPNDIFYLQGAGLPEEKSKDIIRNMIEQYGVKSLYLSDKKELEQKFIEYSLRAKELER